MTPEELARLKAICDGVRERPWSIREFKEHYPFKVAIDNIDGASVAEDIHRHHATFIINARTAMPLLIAEVERLEAENAKLREALEEIANKHSRCDCMDAPAIAREALK